jgi:guanylate kinase
MANDGRPLADTRGLLVILSGPSGSGKSTLVHRLLSLVEFPITFSVSATSRPPRPGEKAGKDYLFLPRDEFLRMRDAGEFIESAEVHGNLYGTPRLPVEEAINAGRWMVLDIDVEGHRQVKALMPEAVSFFVRAGSLETYEARLRARGTESDRQIAIRMDAVRRELASATSYDYQIVNDDLEQAARTWRTLLQGVQAARAR